MSSDLNYEGGRVRRLCVKPVITSEGLVLNPYWLNSEQVHCVSVRRLLVMVNVPRKEEGRREVVRGWMKERKTKT